MGLEWERKERRKIFEASVERAWSDMLNDADSDYDEVDKEELLAAYMQWDRDGISLPLPERKSKEMPTNGTRI